MVENSMYVNSPNIIKDLTEKCLHPVPVFLKGKLSTNKYLANENEPCHEVQTC